MMNGGKRVRTVIVAHNLPNTEKDVNGDPMSSAAQIAFVDQLPHDATTGKLSTYAALGNSEDVALYEKFINEKKARAESPSKGVPSPLTRKASMKRRSILFATDPTDTDKTAMGSPLRSLGESDLSLLRHEVEQDAKLRRASAVAQRKYLQSLPYHERVAYKRQQNVIHKWKQINAEWERFKTKTSKKLGKAEGDLVMSRSTAYREQMETYDALQRAMPLSEKVGGDIWLVSLRNDGTRYVPVGNIFSGLYCPIKEKTQIQPRVRRPLDYQGTTIPNGSDGKERHVRMDALTKTKRRLRKQLQALFPHEVEPSQGGHLCVGTMDLFEWATYSVSITKHQTHPQEPEPVTLLALPSERETTENTVINGPNVHLYLPQAPLDDQEHLHLNFYVNINVPQQKVVYLENTGQIALHFQWTRRPFIPINDDKVKKAIQSTLEQRQVESFENPIRSTWTSLSLLHGIIFPGQVIEFVLTFQSKVAGQWLETWLLDIDPSPERRIGSIRQVHVEATAVDNFVPRTQRRQQSEQVTQKQNAFMCEQVLKKDVIAHVESKHEFIYSDLTGDEPKWFYETHRQSEYENVHYSQALMNQCHALYAEMLNLVQPVESLIDNSEGVETPTTPLHTSKLPREWNKTLSSLKDLAIIADTKQTEAFAILHQQQLQQQQEEDEIDKDDFMYDLTGAKARVREEQQVTLDLSRPRFYDTFRSIILAAQVSPYNSEVLRETLSERLQQMCAETSVVHAIATMVHENQSPTVVSDASVDALLPLLIQAIDQSIDADQKHECTLETTRRRYQGVDGLRNVLTFEQIPRLLSFDQAIKTIIFQVDLDLAHWFTLNATNSTSSPEQTPPSPAKTARTSVPDIAQPVTTTSLEWRLSSTLLEHESYVPPQVISVIESILKILQIAQGASFVPVIVLVTELSNPPMTHNMKKIEDVAIKMNATARGIQDDPVAVSHLQDLMTRMRNDALSLQGVEALLSRSLSQQWHGDVTTEMPHVEFMRTIVELAKSLELGEKTNEVDSLSETNAVENIKESAALRPRIVLLEHIGALGRTAYQEQIRIKVHEAEVNAAAATAAAATISSTITDQGRPTSAAKTKGKGAGAQPTAAVPPAPVPTAPKSTRVEETIDLSSVSQNQMAEAVGHALAKCSKIAIVDVFPRSWWESVFLYFISAANGQFEVSKDQHVVAGPQLLSTLMKWAATFQPIRSLGGSSHDNKAIAVVGGRSLERKLRLIDGLLERCDSIYFVGEIAMTIYRVLYSKKIETEARHRRQSTALRHPWSYLISAIERLQQKAYRKNVQLHLPFDMMVGEFRMEELGNSAMKEVDGSGEDENREDEAESDEEDEDEEDEVQVATNAKAKRMKELRTPLQEPVQVNTATSRLHYDGEQIHVAIPSTTNHWCSFADVKPDMLSADQIELIDANQDRNMLMSNIDGEEGNEEAFSSPVHFLPAPELDWTFRVFDIGPQSIKVLLEHLRQHHDQSLIVNGTVGAIEYYEFDHGTTQLFDHLQAYTTGLFVVGESTHTWFQRIQFDHHKNSTCVVSSTHAKNAQILQHVIENKPHPMLTKLIQSSSFL